MKKLLVTLMCITMVVVMMPTMAFANVAVSNAGGAETTTDSTPTPTENVASVTNGGGTPTGYATLEAAIEAAKDGDTITLNEPITINEKITINKGLILDLGSNTITAVELSENEYMIEKTGDSDVVIKNGSIVSETCRGIYAKSGALILKDIIAKTFGRAVLVDNAVVTIDEGCNISVTGKDAPVIVWGTGDYKNDHIKQHPTLHVYGRVDASNDSNPYAAVQGQGTDKSYTYINIYNGAKLISNGTAIYAPQAGEVNISGGVLTGHSAIGVKSGIVNIKGGTLEANGEYNPDIKTMEGGIQMDGSTIVVDSNGAYAGEMIINISGDAVLKSDNGHAIREIGKTEDETSIVSLNVNGGTLDSELSGFNVRAITDGKVNVSGGTINVNSLESLKKTISYMTGTGRPVINLTSSIIVSKNETIDFNENIDVTADKDVQIKLQPGANMIINADVVFRDFNASTAIVPGKDGTITVNESGTFILRNNEGNGMNGGNLIVNGGTVIAENNGSNGITAKVTMEAGSITAKENKMRGITLTGGSVIGGTAKIITTGNGNNTTCGDIEINTNPAEEGLKTVTISGTATVEADTMTGHAIKDAVAERDKVVMVQGNAVVNIKETAGEGENATDQLFIKNAASGEGQGTKEDTFTSGTLIMPNEKGEVEAVIKGDNVIPPTKFKDVDKVVVKGSLAENTVINVPADTVVKNENEKPVKVQTPSGTFTVEKGKEITSQNPPIYIPVGPTVQKPVIEPNADVTTSLSTDGTKLSIAAKEGFEIVDVTVNGVSKGAVTTISGLKTGDKVVVVTKEVVKEPTEEEKKAEIIKAAKATKLIARSQAVRLKNGKRGIKVYWLAKKGSLDNIDGVQIFRSTKRTDGTYKKVFTSKSGKYINTAVKKGQTYYYKVRGYKRVDGKLYFTSYSTKAWRRV